MDKCIYPDPLDQPGFMIWRLFQDRSNSIETILRNEKITQSDYLTLISIMWLGRNGNEVTQQNLADYTNISAMNISHILNRLKKNGYINKTDAKVDTRSKNISLTELGQKFASKILLPIIDLSKKYFDKNSNNNLKDFLQTL